MSKQELIVYVSDDCKTSKTLINYLINREIAYTERNVTENPEYMNELQKINIYGTPVTFAGENEQPILGFQKSKMDVLIFEN